MTLGANGCRFAGSRPSNMCGGSTRWSSTEITVANTSRGDGSGRNSSGSSCATSVKDVWIETQFAPRHCVEQTRERNEVEVLREPLVDLVAHRHPTAGRL